MQKTIAVDAMGGDHGPSVIVPAVVRVLRDHAKVKFILVGDEAKLRHELTRCHAMTSENLVIHHASQMVEMDEPPAQALRNKKDSSMRVALNLVKGGEAQACVSAGNTGALMATARFVLKTIPGIDRPAISTWLPTIKGSTQVLDLGANIDCSDEQLFQFAVMGSVLAQARGIERPCIGLLNIGQEEIKGNEQVRAASRHLIDTPTLNYMGFVEGDDIYKGTADVIVCDGFVGNIALKTSEGLARMTAKIIRDAFNATWWTRCLAVVVAPVLKRAAKRLDPRLYNGASLVGLRGIVIKSHGGADMVAFANALREASREIDHNIPALIASRIAEFISNDRDINNLRNKESDVA